MPGPSRPTDRSADRAPSRGGSPAFGRSTKQRRLLLEIVTREGRPLSPGELLELARETLPTIGLSTVYRTIRALEDAREIAAVEVPGQPPRYELAQVAAHHHHHFHCIACDRVFDLDGCPGGMKSLLPSGFTLEQHTLVLSGRCRECGA
jgi:Fur family ferric uptake transcriptional regulator